LKIFEDFTVFGHSINDCLRRNVFTHDIIYQNRFIVNLLNEDVPNKALNNYLSKKNSDYTFK